MHNIMTHGIVTASALEYHLSKEIFCKLIICKSQEAKMALYNFYT